MAIITAQRPKMQSITPEHREILRWAEKARLRVQELISLLEQGAPHQVISITVYNTHSTLTAVDRMYRTAIAQGTISPIGKEPA